MLGIQITTTLGVFMLERQVALNTNEFKLEIEEFENVVFLEAVNASLETVYLPKHLLLHAVYKNITS